MQLNETILICTLPGDVISWAYEHAWIGEHEQEWSFIKYLGEYYLTHSPNMDWIFFDMFQKVDYEKTYVEMY